MSRSRFGRWGESLSEGQFAQALAAAGVLGKLSAVRSNLEDLLELLESKEPIPWRFPWGRVSRSVGRDAAKLSNWWAGAVAIVAGRDLGEHRLRGSVRLGLQLEGAGTAAGWVVRELSRNEVGVDGLSIHDPREAAVRWTWPLQIGFLSDPESTNLMAQLQASKYGESLASARTLQAAGDACDLLILPQSLREAAALLLRQVPPIRAGAVVVLGGTLEPWERTDTLRRAVRDETGAGAVFIATVPSPARALWFTNLMEQFSHNAPLDVAFGRSADGDPDRLLFATSSVLEDARLSRAALRMSARMAEAPGDVHVNVDREMSYAIGLEGLQSVSRVGDALRARLESFEFGHESGDATELARLARELESVALTPLSRSPRYLQAQVLSADAYGPKKLRDYFWAGRIHHVDVRIAAADKEWLMPSTDAAFPDLLPLDAGHELLVVFSEPQHLDSPQTAILRLPADGPSTWCRFSFVPRATVGKIDARVAVIHQNRVLQTALLRGRVASAGTSADSDDGITFELEALVHPDTAGLEERTHFHAALVVNRNGDGTRRMLGAAGANVGVMELEGIATALEEIRARLSSTPPTRRGPTEQPFTDDAVELLRFMAYQGRALYDGLIADQFSKSLAAATRIQIVSAKADSFLPLEFVYDRASPAVDAQMCPNAVKAASTGECPDCPSLTFETESPHICPAGFWALTRVIERHAFDSDIRPEGGAQYALYDAPAPTTARRTLRPLRSALFAASDKVDAGGTKRLSERVLKRLAQSVGLSGGTAQAVASWTEWKEGIKQAPALLVVLSHTVKNRQLGAVGLEIAAGDSLLALHIGRDHVTPEPKTEKACERAPVVLLLGCETAAPEIPYQGFVPAFRRAGAAAVVCTNCTVLGREVAPAAEQLVEILEDITGRAEPTALGDALVELRRNCIARGMPMALGLVAYGDADWRLTR